MKRYVRSGSQGLSGITSLPDAPTFIRMLVAMRDADPRDIRNKDGTFKRVGQWPPPWPQMVEGFVIERRRDETGVMVDCVVDFQFIDQRRIGNLIERLTPEARGLIQ